MTSPQGHMPASSSPFGADALGAASGGAPVKALLKRIDASIDRFGHTVRGSKVGKAFRKEWQDFAREWRTFLLEELSHPSPNTIRSASRFAVDLADWKKRFVKALRHPERDGMDGIESHSSSQTESPTVTPGSIRYEWQASKKEVDRLDSEIIPSEVRKVFKHGWRKYAEEWKRAYEHFTGGANVSASKSWRLARAYRHRTRLWSAAFGRECAGGQGGSELGALIVTPGAMLDELNSVNNGVNQLDIDITSSKVRDGFKQAWKAFKAEWKKFYDSKQGFFSRTWGSTMEKAVEYRKRVDQWRAAFSREGGLTTGPTLEVPEPPKSGGGTWKWWAVGGLLAGGAYVGVKVFR
jgi:hypothetical protein